MNESVAIMYRDPKIARKREGGTRLRLSSNVRAPGVTRHDVSSLRRRGIVKLKSMICQKKSFFDRKDPRRTASAVYGKRTVEGYIQAR